MPIHITVDAAAAYAAKSLIERQSPQMDPVQKNRILPVTKYNLLINSFNASTILLVIAVASTLLCAHAAALTCGSIALFTRFAIEKELHKYTLPTNDSQPQGGPAQDRAPLQGVLQEDNNPLLALNQMYRTVIPQTNILRHALKQASQQEKEDNVFQKLGMARPQNWVENEIFFFDFAVWKNRVPVLPEMVDRVLP